MKPRDKIQRPWRWRTALLTLAGIAGVCVTTCVSNLPMEIQSPANRARLARLQSDRWLADARTAIAVADYLFSPDPPLLGSALIVTNHHVGDAADASWTATNTAHGGTGQAS